MTAADSCHHVSVTSDMVSLSDSSLLVQLSNSPQVNVDGIWVSGLVKLAMVTALGKPRRSTLLFMVGWMRD